MPARRKEAPSTSGIREAKNTFSLGKKDAPHWKDVRKGVSAAKAKETQASKQPGARGRGKAGWWPLAFVCPPPSRQSTAQTPPLDPGTPTGRAPKLRLPAATRLSVGIAQALLLLAGPLTLLALAVRGISTERNAQDLIHKAGSKEDDHGAVMPAAEKRTPRPAEAGSEAALP